MTSSSADRGEAAEGASTRPSAAVRALDTALVGRRREIEMVVAAVAAGRHLLLEGPPGTGKTTMLRALAAAFEAPMTVVEGNAELTPARLVGQFDPARVLTEGYTADTFVAGPLVEAMRSGGLLYLEELNRVPEETVNLLIGVMSERELNIPRAGRVAAAGGFRLVAAMNPYDTVGTARVSSAVYDRVCRVAMGYQRFEEELAIVEREAAWADGALDASDPASLPPQEPFERARLVRRAVAVARATRSHPDLHTGASVRGAIDLVHVAGSLAALRQAPLSDPSLGLDAALLALSGRIRAHEASHRSSEEIVAELWERVLAAESADDAAESDPRGADQLSSLRRTDQGKARGPAGPSRPDA